MILFDDGEDAETEFLRSIRIASTTIRPDAAATGSTSRRCGSPTVLFRSFLNDLTFWDVVPAKDCDAYQYKNNHGFPQWQQQALTYSDSSTKNASNPKRNGNRTRRNRNTTQNDGDAATGNSKAIWRTAVDPVSGNTYYYDAITRKTQWRKPAEIKAEEKRLRQERLKQDMIFFNDMEQNIRQSLARGELIPGIPLEETKREGPPLEPKLVPSPTKPTGRVRTISAMDDLLMAELRGEGRKGPLLSQPPNMNRVQFIPTVVQPPSLLQPSTSISGRPPLPTSGPSSRRLIKPNELSETVSSKDCMMVTPTYLDENPSNTMAMVTIASFSNQIMMDDDSYKLSQQLQIHPLRGDSDLAGEKLVLDGPSNLRSQQQPMRPSSLNLHARRNTGGTIYVSNTMMNPDIQATITCVCGVYRAHIVQSKEQQQIHLSPVSVASMNLNNSNYPSSYLNTSTTMDDVQVFRDHYDAYYHHPASAYHTPGNNKQEERASIPTLSDIFAFYQEFFRRSQMEHDAIIMSLIYVERLIKSSNGLITPRPENWRSILFSSMILASKVWDDLSMWNIDFSNVSLTTAGLASFSLRRINQLEATLLKCLNFDVRVPASEYAKYYFLIRTMLLRTGLMQGVEKPLAKEDLPAFRTLEVRTRNYQKSKLKITEPQADKLLPRPSQARRTKSLDDTLFCRIVDDNVDNGTTCEGLLAGQRPIGPVLRETVCLEQLVG